MSIEIRNPKSEIRNESRFEFRASCFVLPAKRGYTLIELIVSVGLFAIIMMLSTGAYFMMLSINRQAQGMATGINNLSFALDSMTRDIRTGNNYMCDNLVGGCQTGKPSFQFVNSNGQAVSYSLNSSAIQKTIGVSTAALTDPSVTVTSLTFYGFGFSKPSGGNYTQARVTIIVTGTVDTGKGQVQSFTVETGATMRGSDI